MRTRWALLAGLALAGCARTAPVSRAAADDGAVARKAIAEQLARIPRCAPEIEARAVPTVSPARGSPPRMALIRGHLEIRGGYGCEDEDEDEGGDEEGSGDEGGSCEGPWTFVPAGPGQEVFLLTRRGEEADFLWELPESALGDLKANTPLLQVVVNGRPDRRPVLPDSEDPLAARELWFDLLCAVSPETPPPRRPRRSPTRRPRRGSSARLCCSCR